MDVHTVSPMESVAMAFSGPAATAAIVTTLVFFKKVVSNRHRNPNHLPLVPGTPHPLLSLSLKMLKSFYERTPKSKVSHIYIHA